MQGFKSFVDLTQLYFNSNRVAIVGPNGCGKSNVIDAIRWVMGETSPRFLRGDLMADVIFNGSLARKGAAQASVEIVLDNHLGYLQGPFVGKGQLALRREINRASESAYFINGKKVRRRDLNDLWLGTGAGARGYAIIGQNMVHQLVEANPEVLRGYLEEAAGVSKYKERRRESRDRLAHVEENIARLRDLMQALEETIQRLSFEAKDAERYHQFRQQIRHFSELKVLAQAREIYQQQQDLQNKFDQIASKEQEIKHQIHQQQQTLQMLAEANQQTELALQAKEKDLFQKKLELKQALQQDTERQQAYQSKQQERLRLAKEVEELKQQFDEESQYLQQQVALIQGLMREQDLLLAKLKQEQILLTESEQQLHQLKSQRAGLRQNQNHQQNQAQMLELKIQHGRSRLNEAHVHIQQLQMKRDDMQLAEITKKRDAEVETSAHLEQELEQIRKDLLALEQEEQGRHQVFVAAKTKYQETEATLQQLTQQYALEQASYQGYLSLITDTRAESMQSADWNRIDEWLKAWQIPSDWQPMVNWLWQRFIPAWLGQVQALEMMPHAYIARLTPLPLQTQDLNLPPLLDFMGLQSYPDGFLQWSQIWVAESKAQAFAIRPQLSDQASVITADGLWLGANWSLCANLEAQGLASQLEVIRQLEQEINLHTQAYETAFAQFQQTEMQWYEIRDQRIHQQQIVQELNLQFRQSQQSVEHLQQQCQSMQTAVIHCQQELARQAQKHTEIDQELREQTAALEQLRQVLDEMTLSERKIQQQIQIQQDEVDGAANRQRQTKLRVDEGELKLTQLKTEEKMLLQHLPKLKKRLQEVEERRQILSKDCGQQPQTFDFSALTILLQEEEQVLQSERDALVLQKQQLQQGSQQIDSLQQAQLKILEKKWKFESELVQIRQKISDIQVQLNADLSPRLWQNLPIEENEVFFAHQIRDLEAKLSHLGDVNLLAIGLYEQERMRHGQLQDQEQDMLQAIEELSKAIATLDKDMQNALQETLAAINQHLLRIFPQLFGGGEAKFVTSCDNLLEATVAVQVQLPGKKQHRIQLLSGGEKALTAIALLFAIFALNPAPFCLLDEVDAALDDANVLRLAGLVKVMSNTVQFILITHNPLTMNVAEELVGVTMQEPGVSRVVSVSMAKALEMVNKE